MLSERTIINGLLIVAGMILGPYLIILTLEVNQIALLSFATIVFLFAIFFVVKDRICAFPFLGVYLGGSLNFLPLGLTSEELFGLTTILYYLINYVALKRRPIDSGPRSFFFPMLVIAAIVLIHDHGLKVLGSGSQGSRQGFLVLLSIAVYICAINIPRPSPSFLHRIPWCCLFLTFCGSAPFLVTTYFPSLAPYVFYISGNINFNAYLESVNGSDPGDTERNTALLSLGATLQAVMVAYFPINTWWHPRRWILIVLSLLCLYATLSGGYRNGFLYFCVTTFIGAVCYCRWRVLVILPLLALVPIGFILIQDNHPGGITLPGSVQRAMSFLPGNWDTDVILSAESSNGFREDIKRVYIHEYLYKSPWIGNGFSFDPGETDGLEALLVTPGLSDKSYFVSKAFITSKNFHIGWISLYDSVGIIGGIAFVLLSVSMIWAAGRLIFGQSAEVTSPLFPLIVFLFSNLTGGMLQYFTTFGNFSGSFTGLCSSAILLVHVLRTTRGNATPDITPSPQMPTNLARHVEVFSPLVRPAS